MYQLSSNFYATEYINDEPMSNLELHTKQIIALTLGILPYGSASLWLELFHDYTNMITATPLMYSIKLFSYSQYLVWGKYVEHPSSDTVHARLAQYGYGDQPWIDLNNIYKAINTPELLEANEWNLEEWKNVTF